MTVLDDVGKTIKVWAEPIQEYRQADVIMVIAAPNGDCCRIFKGGHDNRNPVPSYQWDSRAETVRAFMGSHADVS